MDPPEHQWIDPSDPGMSELRAVKNLTAQRLNFSPRVKLILEVLMVVMCVGAVTGNILVILIVAATKTFHSVASILIINLAISDFLVGIGVMPFIAVSIMNNAWVDCTDLCQYVGYTSSVYCTASVLTLAAIALDRYHSIVDCLRYSSRCTAWRTGAVVLWIWTQAALTSCPPLLGWGAVDYVAPMFTCVVRWSSSASYAVTMATLSFLLPGVVILFCYVKIVRVARSHARRIHSLEGHIHRNRRGGPGHVGALPSTDTVWHLPSTSSVGSLPNTGSTVQNHHNHMGQNHTQNSCLGQNHHIHMGQSHTQNSSLGQKPNINVSDHTHTSVEPPPNTSTFSQNHNTTAAHNRHMGQDPHASVLHNHHNTSVIVTYNCHSHMGQVPGTRLGQNSQNHNSKSQNASMAHNCHTKMGRGPQNNMDQNTETRVGQNPHSNMGQSQNVSMGHNLHPSVGSGNVGWNQQPSVTQNPHSDRGQNPNVSLARNAPSPSGCIYHLSLSEAPVAGSASGETGRSPLPDSSGIFSCSESSTPDSFSSSGSGSESGFGSGRLHSSIGQCHSDSPSDGTQPPSPAPQPPPSQSHGIVRLFLVIAAFFLCWTPYICVAMVQAAEKALSGSSASSEKSLVPPSAVTFSYWLLLLNSDINPLLYALLSRRFQGALRSLRGRMRARLGGLLGMVAADQGEGEGGREGQGRRSGVGQRQVGPGGVPSHFYPEGDSTGGGQTPEGTTVYSSMFTLSPSLENCPGTGLPLSVENCWECAAHALPLSTESCNQSANLIPPSMENCRECAQCHALPSSMDDSRHCTHGIPSSVGNSRRCDHGMPSSMQNGKRCAHGTPSSVENYRECTHGPPVQPGASLSSSSSCSTSSSSTSSSSSSSCSQWHGCQHAGSTRRLNCLQVPSQPHRGDIRPCPAAMQERQATFFYGQITVRVEHDVC